MSRDESKVICAFVPVLHQGYLDFFRSHLGAVRIFGPTLIKSYVHLTRDIRALNPIEMLGALRLMLPERDVALVEPTDFAAWDYAKVLMPDDEVCHDIAQKYLGGRAVEFVSVFLRWNKVITFKESEVVPNRKISREQFDQEMMEQASQEGQKSSDWWRPIGALALRDKRIIFSAYNHHLPSDFHLVANGDPRSNFDAGQHQEVYTSIHAEAGIVAQAARAGESLEGALIYSTTFPCPNCARLLGIAGVKTLYYSKGYSLLDAEKILNYFGVEIILVE